MTVRPILCWPDPALSHVCAPVTQDVTDLIADMFDTMYAAPGRGLAAPQIGALQRVFVMDAGWKDGVPSPRACINPTLVTQGETVACDEGCLSVPGVLASVTRPSLVILSYTDENGAECSVNLAGADAVIAQHEADHLDGIMHFDRLDEAARAVVLATYAVAL